MGYASFREKGGSLEVAQEYRNLEFDALEAMAFMLKKFAVEVLSLLSLRSICFLL